MLFGMVGWTSPGIRHVFGFGDQSTGVILGANLGRAIVTNGDIVAYLCKNV